MYVTLKIAPTRWIVRYDGASAVMFAGIFVARQHHTSCFSQIKSDRISLNSRLRIDDKAEYASECCEHTNSYFVGPTGGLLNVACRLAALCAMESSLVLWS